ncbi:MAG TPA: radical SAM protein [Thermoanaerobaculia bacterium]|nr:radical SAM protein [Thermoanaerobaculia bacterium]
MSTTTVPSGLDDFTRSAEPSPSPSPSPTARPAAVPHVVAWNLTNRCNLACAHCYIAAGPWHAAAGELTTDEVKRISDEILALNPSPMFVLSGGEPLLRTDLEDIARHAKQGGATVVVGTNGTGLTAERISSLQEAGVTGVAISVDSLTERYHDRFRHGDGALSDTLAAVDRLREARLDFLVQTTVTKGNRAELPEIAAWAADSGAVCFNVYFLVETGRGEGMRGLAPEENEEVLDSLVGLGRDYRGRMMVRSKCEPQIMRHVHAADPDSPLLNYATRCPCGIQYCRITPEGKVTPCPYLPAEAGDLREQSFAEVWNDSEVFRALREGELEGRCGSCEYRAICGGCRARAYAGGGGLLGTDESCAYQPAEGAELILPQGGTKYGEAVDAELAWSDDARARVERIPSFVRGVVMKRVETYARREGIGEVTVELLDRIRQEMPVDFSKKLPFFARRGDD